MALTPDQIAEKFSKGQQCGFVLTRKQADWLLNSGNYTNSHFGRRYGKGQFRNETGLYRWEATEGYHGSANFKVTKISEEEKQQTLQEFVTERGYDFDEIMNTPLLGQLAVEYAANK